MPYDPLENSRQMDSLMKGDYGVQFSHTIQKQIVR